MSKISERRKQTLINRVIKGFDFAKVYRIMVVLNWTWIDHIPDIPEMKSQAYRLLTHVLNDDNCFAAGTGGFIAAKHGEELTLSFILTESVALLKENEITEL